MFSPDLTSLIESLPQRYKLCVSDFDGVQGFTEDLQMNAYIKILEKYAGITLKSEDIAPGLVGRTEADNLATLREKYGLRPDLPSLIQERNDIYMASVFATRLQPNGFMVDISRRFAVAGNKSIIASNSTRQVILDILNYWGTCDLFAAIYTSDTFPNTEILLPQRKLDFILNHLPTLYGLRPEEMIVFEDSVSTCEKVQAAGFAVGFVKHKFNNYFYPETGLVFESAVIANEHRE